MMMKVVSFTGGAAGVYAGLRAFSTVFVGVEKDAAPKPEREPVSAAATVRTDIVFSC